MKIYTTGRKCSGCGNEPAPGQRLCVTCHAAYMRNWRKTHRLSGPQRLKDGVRSRVSVSIQRGTLTRGTTCERADSTCKGKIEAHHEDYSKPLAVTWLCRSHHVRLECEKAGKTSRAYAVAA